MFLDSKGIIWIGTGSDKTALVRFDYSALNKNNKEPAVFIQSIKVNNEDICWYNLICGFSPKVSEGETTSSLGNLSAIINEEVTKFRKTLSEDERNTMRKKFKEIKFDSITKWYPIPKILFCLTNTTA